MPRLKINVNFESKDPSPLCASQLNPTSLNPQHAGKHIPGTGLQACKKTTLFSSKEQCIEFIQQMEQHPNIIEMIAKAILSFGGDFRLFLDLNIHYFFPETTYPKKYLYYSDAEEKHLMQDLNWISVALDFCSELQNHSQFECTLQTIFPVANQHKASTADNCTARLEIMLKNRTICFYFFDEQGKPLIYIKNNSKNNIFKPFTATNLSPVYGSRSSLSLEKSRAIELLCSAQNQSLSETDTRSSKRVQLENACDELYLALKQPNPSLLKILETESVLSESEKKLIMAFDCGYHMREYWPDLKDNPSDFSTREEEFKQLRTMLHEKIHTLTSDVFSTINDEEFKSLARGVIDALGRKAGLYSFQIGSFYFELSVGKSLANKIKKEHAGLLAQNKLGLLKAKLILHLHKDQPLKKMTDVLQKIISLIQQKNTQYQALEELINNITACEIQDATILEMVKEREWIKQRRVKPAMDHLKQIINNRIDSSLMERAIETQQHLETHKEIYFVSTILDVNFKEQQLVNKEKISKHLIELVDLIITHHHNTDSGLSDSIFDTLVPSYCVKDADGYTLSDEIYAFGTMPHDDFCLNIEKIKQLIQNVHQQILHGENSEIKQSFIVAIQNIALNIATMENIRTDYPYVEGILLNQNPDHILDHILFGLQHRLQFEQSYTDLLAPIGPSPTETLSPSEDSPLPVPPIRDLPTKGTQLIDDYLKSHKHYYVPLSELKLSLSRFIFTSEVSGSDRRVLATDNARQKSSVRGLSLFSRESRIHGEPLKMIRLDAATCNA